MTTLREAAQQALEALESAVEYDYHGTPLTETHAGFNDAATALKAALAEPNWQDLYLKEKKRADMWRDKYESVAGAEKCIHPLAEPVQEPQCNPHPKAPHGFLRNASHTEDRYVCECEYWEPYEAGYQAGMEAALRAQS